jgi:hypothetical protein
MTEQQQQQQACFNVSATVEHVKKHVIELLVVHQRQARLDTVSALEKPKGSYVFKISGVSDYDQLEEELKRALGKTYSPRCQRYGLGELNVIINVAKLDSDTAFMTNNDWKKFETATKLEGKDGTCSQSTEDDDDDSSYGDGDGKKPPYKGIKVTHKTQSSGCGPYLLGVLTSAAVVLAWFLVKYSTPTTTTTL